MLPKVDLWPAHAGTHAHTQLWRISLSRLFTYMKETDTERVANPNTTHIQTRIRTLDSRPKALTFVLVKNLAALSLCAFLAPILSPKPQIT